MTYRLEPLETEKDISYRRANLMALMDGERMRCQACSGIYFRVFYDRAQCMSCRNFTRFATTPADGFNDLRSSQWVRMLLEKFPDGRVRDPKSGRPEFVVYRDRLVSRISGTICFLDSPIKGTWLLGDKYEAKKLAKSAMEMREAVQKSPALKNLKGE